MFTVIRKYFSPFVHDDEELTLLQIFKPLYLLFSALGLFPYAIEFPSRKRDIVSVSLKSNALNLTCYLLLVSAIPIALSVYIWYLSIATRGENQLIKHNITKVNYISSLFIVLVVSITIYVSAVKYRNLYVKIFSEMDACWAALPSNTSSIILGKLRVQVNCVVLGSFLLIVSVNSASTYSQLISAVRKIIFAATFVLPAVLQYAIVAFFLVMMLMIVALLNNIEEHLTILARRGIESPSVSASLRQLRRVCARVLATKRQINSAFQAPLLLILALSTYTLVTTIHMLYHILIFQPDYHKHNIRELCCWACYQLVKIYALGYPGALLRQQALKIGRSLYNIPVHENEDIELHVQIQNFASMVTFEDTELTVYNYFSLEPSLIFNILASVATYVIILVQFDKPS